MIGLIQKLFRLKAKKPIEVNLEIKDIQGLLIKSYSHLSHSNYLFFEIQDPQKAQKWLEECLANDRFTAAYRAPGVAPDAIKSAMNIAFTAKGMEAIGASKTLIESFAPEFQQGMQHIERSRRIGDYGTLNDPKNWEESWSKLIHLMVVLQGKPSEMKDLRDNLISECASAGLGFIDHEEGYLPADHKEHFGFTDSISQPTIEGSPRAKRSKRLDSQLTKAGEFILGYINEDGNFPQTPFVHISEDKLNCLAALPNRTKRDFGKNGSYFVYRKMEQDVAKFRQYFDSVDDGAKMAAKAVGRWPSGVSLVDSPDQDPGADNYIRNDFGYRDRDPDGSRCPFASHVRRLNPRDSQGDNKEDALKSAQRRRIIRRGTVYGDRLPDGQLESDNQPRGLHFFCINANIRRQFEFLQQSWVNNPKFHGLYEERDPLIGVNPDDSDRMMTVPDEDGAKTLSLPNFVKVKGGEYFFMPSLSAIRFLSQL